MAKKRKRSVAAAMRGDGHDLFIDFNGKPIAKRGHPGTPQAKTWVPLEPGYRVYDSADGNQIVVEEDRDVGAH